jgi:nitrogen regulatory protein PII
MKEIKAYVRQEELEAVVEALEQAGAPEITIVRTDVAGADLRPEIVEPAARAVRTCRGWAAAATSGG